MQTHCWGENASMKMKVTKQNVLKMKKYRKIEHDCAEVENASVEK